MGDKTLIVVTHDRALAALLGLLPDVRIRIATLPDEILTAGRLLVDLRAVKACCLQHLERCAKHGPAPTETVISHLEGPRLQSLESTDSLIALPPALEVESSPTNRDSRRSLARRAWAERTSVLSLETRSESIRAFILLAGGQHHRGWTVPEVATHLGMSVRQIHRCVVCELHYAPIVVLGLARVVRVAHDVLTTRRLLTKIAQARGYRDLAGMDRQFRKFVGISPGGYRASRGPSTSETAK